MKNQLKCFNLKSLIATVGLLLLSSASHAYVTTVKGVVNDPATIRYHDKHKFMFKGLNMTTYNSVWFDPHLRNADSFIQYAHLKVRLDERTGEHGSEVQLGINAVCRLMGHRTGHDVYPNTVRGDAWDLVSFEPKTSQLIVQTENLEGNGYAVVVADITCID